MAVDVTSQGVQDDDVLASGVQGSNSPMTAGCTVTPTHETTWCLRKKWEAQFCCDHTSSTTHGACRTNSGHSDAVRLQRSRGKTLSTVLRL